MRTHAFVLKGVLFVVERACVGNHRVRGRGAILWRSCRHCHLATPRPDQTQARARARSL